MSSICYLGLGFSEFNIASGTHMDPHKICDLTFFTCWSVFWT